MTRLLFLVTAMALTPIFCGTVKGDDRNGHPGDDRQFDSYPNDFRPFDFRQFSPGPVDFYQHDFRRFDYYQDDFRPFDYYQDDPALRLNDYCFRQGHDGGIA